MMAKSVSATEFKAKCLAVLDEVGDSDLVVTITKRGRPVATLQGAKKPNWRSLKGVLKGKIDLDALGDIISPPPNMHWEVADGLVCSEHREKAKKPRKSA